MTGSWLVVAGDVTPLGGMDMANYALARYLAQSGADVQLVAHRAWPDLAALPSVTLHRVWRPLGRHLLGSPLLSFAGRRVWRRLSRGGRAVVNGGNCLVPGAANWVHYLHAAYRPRIEGSPLQKAKASFAYARDLAAERTALEHARVVICNSRRTKRDVVERAGVDPRRAHIVYYGTDPVRLAPPAAAERRASRAAIGVHDDRPLVGFVGALGDRRKGFDTVFDAWSALCGGPDWDGDLIVVGTGAELPAWRERAAREGHGDRFRFLGFRPDVPGILAALDALVHPARYEAYGLSVHEAICRGVPAIVSSSAGVAERYPDALALLLLDNPDDPVELAGRLRRWREAAAPIRELVAPFSAELRSRSWDDMARQIVDLAARAACCSSTSIAAGSAAAPRGAATTSAASISVPTRRRIPSWPHIPATRSGSSGATRADSDSRNACRPWTASSTACTTSAGRRTGSSVSSTPTTRTSSSGCCCAISIG
jgi:glycosyltransferase involved in cell wall biosynthesis